MTADRRLFLQFLAASPLFAAAAWAQQSATASNAGDILTVMDFEEAARRVLACSLGLYGLGR